MNQPGNDIHNLILRVCEVLLMKDLKKITPPRTLACAPVKTKSKTYIIFLNYINSYSPYKCHISILIEKLLQNLKKNNKPN